MKKLKSYRFDEKTIELIEEIRQTLGLENNSAVLRRSITLLKLAADASNKGSKIIVRDDNGDREILL